MSTTITTHTPELQGESVLKNSVFTQEQRDLLRSKKLTIGDTISFSFEVLKQNFWKAFFKPELLNTLMYVLWGGVYVSIAVIVLLVFTAGEITLQGAETFGASGLLAGVSFVIIFAIALVTLVPLSLFTSIKKLNYLQNPDTTKYFSLKHVAAVMLPVFLNGLVIFLVSTGFQSAFDIIEPVPFIGSFLSFIGAVAWLFVSVFLAFTPYFLVFENNSVFDSITRSILVVKKSYFYYLTQYIVHTLVLLLASIPLLVVITVIVFLVFTMGMAAAVAGGAEALILIFVCGLIGIVVSYIIFGIAVTLYSESFNLVLYSNTRLHGTGDFDENFYSSKNLTKDTYKYAAIFGSIVVIVISLITQSVLGAVFPEPEDDFEFNSDYQGVELTEKRQIETI